MFDQSISEKSLRRLLAKGDRKKYELGESKEEFRRNLSEMATRISSPTFEFSPFRTAKQRHGQIFTPIRSDDEFAIRKLNDNLKRQYSIRMADRNVIVPQVITLAREGATFHLVKLDIEKFFDNVDRNQLLEKLLADPSLSHITRELLKKLFTSPQLSTRPGLPRGLSISSTLAEYALQKFDAECRRLPYCYYYVRYVDDMLFFCHENPEHIEADIQSHLPLGLKLNDAKFARIDVNKGICTTSSKSTDRISYLGYELIYPTDTGTKKLQITIPSKKVNQIKTRVVLTLLDHIKKPNYHLLRMRLRFLSSNFRVSGSRHLGILYSGIYFNHRHIDDTSKAVFDDIDDFIRRAVFSKAGTLGKRLHLLLTDAQRKELCSYSLRAGHSQPKFRQFTNLDLKQIMKAWSHV